MGVFGIDKRKKAKPESTTTTVSTPRFGSETAPPTPMKPGHARSQNMNKPSAPSSGGKKGAISASKANKGGKKMKGTGNIGKAMLSWAKAKPCKKGSKRCGPNK